MSVKPTVSYLTKVRNCEGGEEEAHGGHEEKHEGHEEHHAEEKETKEHA